jgi:hypothetical protein
VKQRSLERDLIFELSLKKEPEDPKYEYDRARFCLSGEALTHAQEARRNMDNLKHVVDGWKEKEEHKEEYDAVAKLQKLSIPQVKAHIEEGLKDERYTNLIFEKPTLERIVSMGFTIEDPTESTGPESRSRLTKVLKKLLADTNWRLMSDGISYRLGVLSGRIRVYESDEDLIKLIQK